MIAARLSEYRHERGLSQTGLSAASGVSLASVKMLEAGKHAARIDTLEKLARVLGIPIADLLN